MKNSLHGLQLVTPGALGLSFFSNDYLHWMATTEALLLLHHELDYLSTLLTELLVGWRSVKPEPFPILRARNHPVITSMIQDVALACVINEGVRRLGGYTGH